MARGRHVELDIVVLVVDQVVRAVQSSIRTVDVEQVPAVVHSTLNGLCVRRHVQNRNTVHTVFCQRHHCLLDRRNGVATVNQHVVVNNFWIFVQSPGVDDITKRRLHAVGAANQRNTHRGAGAGNHRVHEVALWIGNEIGVIAVLRNANVLRAVVDNVLDVGLATETVDAVVEGDQEGLNRNTTKARED